MSPQQSESAYGNDAIYEQPDCPVCGSSRQQQLYQRRKRSGTSLGEITISVSQCSDCGFVYNSPRVRQTILAEHYYSSPLASGQTYRDEGPQGYYTGLNQTRARFLNSFLGHQAQGKLLDIGCGVGGFLDAFSNEAVSAWQCFGLEPSLEASASATAKGYQVETAMLAQDGYEAESFDAISLVSVLEHLPDLHQALQRLSELLKADGILFIEVPNLLKPELSLTGFFSLEHIQHFTPGSLAALLGQYGLTQIIIDPNVSNKIIRLVAARQMGRWSDAALLQFADDRTEATAAVKAYAEKEQQLLTELERNVAGSFARWQQQGFNIAIYGAGIHTAELMGHFDLQAVTSVLIDGDPKKQGTRFLGLPVYAPEQIVELGVDAILVSSNRFQDEIVRNIRQLAGDRVEIAMCYSE